MQLSSAHLSPWGLPWVMPEALRHSKSCRSVCNRSHCWNYLSVSKGAERCFVIHPLLWLDCSCSCMLTVTWLSGIRDAADHTCACMQARQALTGALKIWWDQSQLHSVNNAPDWQPALLPAMFVGAKAAAMESSAGPIQVPIPPQCLFCCTSLLPLTRQC